MSFTDNIVSYKKLTKFYLPLIISGLSISMTHFFMNIALGKMADPDLYISAYNTSRSLVFLFQSLGIGLAYVVTTFTVNEKTFKKVTRYSAATIIILAIMLSTLSFTPLSRWIFSNLYNLADDLLDKSVVITRFVMFFSLSVCIRHYFVGVALKLKYNPFISVASFLRLCVMILLNILMVPMMNNINNDYLPGLMLMLCGITEFLVLMVSLLIYTKDLKKSVVNVCKQSDSYNAGEDVSYKQILVFIAPIMLTFLFGKLVPGVTNSALALAENNERVIAAYSIAMVVTNMLGSIMMSFQHIIINHDSLHEENKHIMRNFGLMLALISCSIMCIIAFTPFGNFVLIDILNTLPETAKLSKIMFGFMILNPLFMVYTNYYYGYLMKIKKTNMLIFQRVISSIIPYSLFFIIKVVPWEYAAAMGGLVMCTCNLASGIYNNVVFNITYKRWKVKV